MNMRFSPILFLPCLFSVECVAADWEEIIPTIEMMYPIWQINGQIINESGGFELILAEPGVTSLTIPDAETVLNGASWTLLGMTANVTGNAQEEYLLGTSVEGPTHGQLFVFTGPSRESTSIACHKIVMMYLVDMTGDGLAEIVTYEDHHYGTSTTRRVFNIYQVRAPLVIARIFAHDVVDLTCSDECRYYTVDYLSLHDESTIIVTQVAQPNQPLRYVWDGEQYAQQTTP